MEYQTYLEQLKEDIRIKRELQGEGLKKSFVQTICAEIPDSSMDDLRQLYVDRKIGNRKLIIDGYIFDSEEHTLTLIVADWHEFQDTNYLTESEATILLKQLSNIFILAKKGALRDEFEFSTPEYELVEIIRTFDIERVHLMIFTDRSVSLRLQALDAPEIENVATDADIWGPERLYDFIKSGLDHEPLKLDFSDGPIPLTLATVGDGYKAYLGAMPANKLAELYKNYGGKMLEGNVRSFLTLKTAVNKDIRGTILGHPEKFFIFNNGIAVTTRKLNVDENGAMISATDFQIINGGQTTASLARAVVKDKADISNIMVSMKLTAIEESLDERDALDLMRNISRCSNNQNKVSGADFSSNHPLHVFVQQCAERIVAPATNGRQHGVYWFYERNRGSFEQKKVFLKAGDLAQFNLKFDKKRVIKKEDLAKVWLSWNGKPQIVSKGAMHLFAYYMNDIDATYEEDKRKGKYEDAFFTNTVSLFIMYCNLRDAISKQTWYGGYRANIVTYAIAAFATLFEEKYGKALFKFALIWEKQSVPEDLLYFLLVIAELVNNVLTDDTRLSGNVTEWAKKDQCWERVQKKVTESFLEWPQTSNTWSLNKDEKKEINKGEKEKGKVRIDLELQEEVLAYTHWQDALTFARNCTVLSDMEIGSLGKAAMIPKRIPYAKECKLALQALGKLRIEGFKF